MKIEYHNGVYSIYLSKLRNNPMNEIHIALTDIKEVKDYFLEQMVILIPLYKFIRGRQFDKAMIECVKQQLLIK
jgi:hypothetical protein